MKDNIPSELEVMRMSILMKVLSDASRLKILFTILKKPKSVQQIETSVHMTQSAVSHQLSLLRKAEIVETNRDGNKIYYSIKDKGIVDLLKLFIKAFNEGY